MTMIIPKPEKTISESQVNMLIEHTTELHYKVLFQLLFLTGLRLEDAINLEICSDSTTSVPKVSFRDRMGRTHTVVLPKEIFGRLNDYCVTHGSPDHYFPEHIATRVEATKVFNIAAKEIGLSQSFTLHSLRESAMLSKVQAGATAESIFEATGHTPITLSSYYPSKSSQL
ncbi:tyrosine-type recombinase/integrase [Shewanella avicenniae]|uniref:Tyrosine-type recombinase/integrase n=1 Tax=Shewanella avicenniae TaxID=2814294 RepID=A0ABX7QQM6_9GAMM|nr:tyrosine-type recombinase/integrase [Shewanella avicenniae]QSX33764.1 tyrosine-type recombinase/integrase [Shewanella avicenniae]